LNKYLGEEQVIPPQGFKSGRITYGLCDRPDKILRIKLKFADSSKDFFNILLGKYKEKLGEPDEYKGDPFQTIIAWKWSFTNEQNEKISLILQHNMMVKDEKMGNSVKLTLISQFEKEEKCCLAKIVKKKPSVQPKLNKKAMWKLFVPF
jgi:hypothetical protein